MGPLRFIRRYASAVPLYFRIRRSARIVLGAASHRFAGWVSTDQRSLDATKRPNFERYWKPGTRTAFLAEHVWEHLTEEQGRQGIVNCFEFLAPGGRLRIAVPDGFNPDPVYREHVRPGGSGEGADDHKVLYNYQTLAASFAAAGFEVRLLEYWDERGEFHAIDWSPDDGPVGRSKRFDPRNQGGKLGYTSLIIDGIKPG